MEIKRFSEYTNDEQKQLLMHWWHYYGKLPVTLAEIEEFMEILDSDVNLIKNTALIFYAKGETSQDLVVAIRNGIKEQFFDQVREISTTLEFEDYEEELEKHFISEMVRTINNPEESKPMSLETILATIMQLEGKSSPLTSENVINIYKECLLRENEVKDNEPLVDFLMAEGIMAVTVFNAERLSARKDDIVSMIDELANLEEGISFLTLCMDKNGRQWTGDHRVMDLLIQLGIGIDYLSYCLPRDMWKVFPGQMPYLIKGKEKEEIIGNKPHEFKKLRDEMFKKKDTK